MQIRSPASIACILPATPGSSQAGNYGRDYRHRGLVKRLSRRLAHWLIHLSFPGIWTEGRTRIETTPKHFDKQGVIGAMDSLLALLKSKAFIGTFCCYTPFTYGPTGRKTCSYLLTWPQNLLKSILARRQQRYLKLTDAFLIVKKKHKKKPFLWLTFQTEVYSVTHENNFYVPLQASHGKSGPHAHNAKKSILP